MKRVTLDELLYSHSDLTYDKQYNYIISLIEKGKIKQVPSSGTNGKKPALHLKYWVIEEEKDYSGLEEELKYTLHPKISIDYYLSHLKTYEKDRRWVKLLDTFLKEKKEKLQNIESVNERSFEIWNREKFLSGEEGKKILKRCGLEMADINVYCTSEPLAYYSRTRAVPQNILILENKDTFYSMRQHLINGSKAILGTEIGTLVYGAGKRGIRSFEDFELGMEPYIKEKKNTIYYFGDLDYEGIVIYESMAGKFKGFREIIPFVSAYEKMLKKAESDVKISNLPDTKEQQNRNIKNVFFSYFPDSLAGQSKMILECGKYIPQEILNIADF